MQIKFSKKIKKVLSGFSISAFIVLMILIFGSTQHDIQGSTRNSAEAMENIFYDLFFKAATHSEKAVEDEEDNTHKRVSISDSLDQNIYIVDIDEASLTKLGNYNEWDRSIHAKVIKNLSEGGASVETDVKLDKGVFVSFSIDSELGTVSLRGVIIRVKEDKHGYFDYTYGVSFVETSKNYMQYFYLQQRKQLYEQNNDND